MREEEEKRRQEDEMEIKEMRKEAARKEKEREIAEKRCQVMIDGFTHAENTVIAQDQMIT